ncbi:hypothetical protein L596_014875 [Steinernema carpocapsae]|uniref:Uncharacterized protein n=1 Tax=Steinernema carpocapsae TaxID=34508 RepID=A0A4U5NE27_STECR|nr:hypothetical protein L596_014875 [Steinernema carpocapsae]
MLNKSSYTDIDITTRQSGTSRCSSSEIDRYKWTDVFCAHLYAADFSKSAQNSAAELFDSLKRYRLSKRRPRLPFSRLYFCPSGGVRCRRKRQQCVFSLCIHPR